jgi:hypothetical protein
MSDLYWFVKPCRARKMSRATSNLAQSVLNGVLTTSGFFTGAAFKSKAGKKFFKLLPGEVALVSMDAFGKVSIPVQQHHITIIPIASYITAKNLDKIRVKIHMNCLPIFSSWEMLLCQGKYLMRWRKLGET